MEVIKIVRIKDTEYLRRAKAESSGTILELFSRTDTDCKKPLGEIEIDPVLGKYLSYRFYR
jgi:hypothetical protein